MWHGVTTSTTLREDDLQEGSSHHKQVKDPKSVLLHCYLASEEQVVRFQTFWCLPGEFVEDRRSCLLGMFSWGLLRSLLKWLPVKGAPTIPRLTTPIGPPFPTHPFWVEVLMINVMGCVDSELNIVLCGVEVEGNLINIKQCGTHWWSVWVSKSDRLMVISYYGHWGAGGIEGSSSLHKTRSKGQMWSRGLVQDHVIGIVIDWEYGEGDGVRKESGDGVGVDCCSSIMR